MRMQLTRAFSAFLRSWLGGFLEELVGGSGAGRAGLRVVSFVEGEGAGVLWLAALHSLFGSLAISASHCDRKGSMGERHSVLPVRHLLGRGPFSAETHYVLRGLPQKDELFPDPKTSRIT